MALIPSPEVQMPTIWQAAPAAASVSPAASSRSSCSSCSSTSARPRDGGAIQPVLGLAMPHRKPARSTIDLSEEDEGATLAAMTVQGRPGTAEACRETLMGLVHWERASRVKAETTAQELQAEVQDLQTSNSLMLRALQERTDQQKQLERDARMQVVLFRSREEEQRMTCDELARRLVEARRVVLQPSERALAEKAAPSENVEHLDSFRKRLLTLLSAEDDTSLAAPEAQDAATVAPESDVAAVADAL
eukprot:CAMPEP_0197654810 /NCGR_PEP_ID=MMETSP1338-20131121/39071_1 /TAXON_ID=43686 ORGANISM="Pelagodinium beii, Strain RCC1491" /NCGR_SAMPLE_ID=MMETSP1338 /ASSEMBLY_ACC=CAM_ASM_000754 /LENGTH=247 /DNA_ID=CAMNT_0043230323 /DNA_START=120 /DNA_END=860 /DNA_ORIENTATION=-